MVYSKCTVYFEFCPCCYAYARVRVCKSSPKSVANYAEKYMTYDDNMKLFATKTFKNDPK